jgi:hypothetical protein
MTMTSRGYVLMGLALWLVATAHVTTILLMPFLPVSAGIDAWKPLLASLGLTALAGCYGFHCIDRHGDFWTLKRLIGLSALALAAVFATALFRSWHGEENPLLDSRFTVLLLVNAIITGPLGYAGVALFIKGKKKREK